MMTVPSLAKTPLGWCIFPPLIVSVAPVAIDIVPITTTEPSVTTGSLVTFGIVIHEPAKLLC